MNQVVPTRKITWLLVVRILILVVLLIGMVIAVRHFIILHHPRLSDVVEKIRSLHPYDEWAYAAACAIGPMLFVPDTVLNIVGAELFGPNLGTVLSVSGLLVGATISYFLSTFLGRQFVERLVGSHLDTFHAKIRRYGFWGILLFRTFPLLPFGVVSYAAGLAGIRFRDYMVATLLGTIPSVFVYQTLFKTARDVIVRHASGMHHLNRINMAMFAVGFVLAVAFAAFLWKRGKRLDSAPSTEVMS